jgi:hypothetical protein
LILGFSNRALLAQLCPATGFTRLFVVLALSQLFLDAASLQQLLKAAQGQANRLSIVNTHPQGHSALLSWGNSISAGVQNGTVYF